MSSRRARPARKKSAKSATRGTLPASIATGEDYSRKLPDEMIYTILAYLSQPHLLRAARVCRWWRAIAHTLPAYYAHLTLEAENLQTTFAYHKRIDSLERDLDRATAAGFRRLSLSISIRCYTSFNLNSGSAADVLELFRDIVLDAFPKYLPGLAKLSISVPGDYLDDLNGSLAHPAPVLESFTLHLLENDPVNLDEEPESAVLLPTLFQGNAPKLTTVRLDGVSWGKQVCVPAFSCARDVLLESYVDTVVRSIPRVFPAVEHLTLWRIESNYEDSDVYGVPVPPFPSLASLVITLVIPFPEAVMAMLKQRAIPRIYARLWADYYTHDNVSIAPFTMHLSAPIHLSFCYLDYEESHIYPEPIRGEGDTDDAVIELHSAADNSRVTVVLDHYQLSHALNQLHDVAERITQITMEFGQSLLEAFDVLPQLTTLRVLLSDTPDTVSRNTFNKKPIVECPLLDTVVVYAPGQYGLDRLDEIRAAIHFVAPMTKRGDPNRPRLILQGDALPKLASAPTLRSRAREVAMEPTHSISILAGCCRTTPTHMAGTTPSRRDRPRA